MKSFSMLHAMRDPLECGLIGKGERFYIGGKRVAEFEFRRIGYSAARKDCFQTVTRGDRVLQYVVCYL